MSVLCTPRRFPTAHCADASRQVNIRLIAAGPHCITIPPHFFARRDDFMPQLGHAGLIQELNAER
jgi:hypothetical protein